MRIGIVNDMALAREALRRVIVSAPGLAIAWTARDGAEALDFNSNDPADLILMDLSLPRMDGWEATKRIRLDDRFRSTPVIALTAHAGRDDEQRARAAGCSDYLTKPVERDKLLGVIRKHLSTRRLHA